jgi:hypothetical protein
MFRTVNESKHSRAAFVKIFSGCPNPSKSFDIEGVVNFFTWMSQYYYFELEQFEDTVKTSSKPEFSKSY